VLLSLTSKNTFDKKQLEQELQNYAVIPAENSITFDSKRYIVLQRYHIAQNYRILHKLVQRLSRHNLKIANLPTEFNKNLPTGSKVERGEGHKDRKVISRAYIFSFRKYVLYRPTYKIQNRNAMFIMSTLHILLNTVTGTQLSVSFIFLTHPQLLLCRSNEGERDGRNMWHASERKGKYTGFWWENQAERDHLKTKA
jgi:hypothetical protein